MSASEVLKSQNLRRDSTFPHRGNESKAQGSFLEILIMQRRKPLPKSHSIVIRLINVTFIQFLIGWANGDVLSKTCHDVDSVDVKAFQSPIGQWERTRAT